MNIKNTRKELHLKQESLTSLDGQDCSRHSKRLRLEELDADYLRQIIYLRNVLRKARARQLIKPAALKKMRLPKIKKVADAKV